MIDVVKMLQLIAEIEALRRSLKGAKEEDIPDIALKIATLANELKALQQNTDDLTAEEVIAHATNQQVPE